MRNESIKEQLQLHTLRLVALLRHFLQLMGQRHAPALAPVRQPRS